MAEVTGGTRIMGVVKGYADRLNSAHEVRVGFLEGATYPDGTPVAQVAAINNFGAPEAGIPARPFFTNMVEVHQDEWGDQFAENMKGSNGDSRLSLEAIGTAIADALRQSITDGAGPPNSPVTDLLKYRFPLGQYEFSDVLKAREDVAAGKTAQVGKPLVWSGHMLHSVEYEIGKDVFSFDGTTGGYVKTREIE